MAKAEGDGGLLSRWGSRKPQLKGRESAEEPGMEKLGGKSASPEEPASAKALRVFVLERVGSREWRVARAAGGGRARWVGPARLLL